jgi:hypothetical protein
MRPRAVSDPARRSRPLGDLERRLRASRRRWFVSRTLVGFGWTAALVAVLAFAVRSGQHAGVAAPLWIVYAGSVVGGLASVGMAWHRTPSLRRVARQADRRFDTKSQLSTALEWTDVDPQSPAQAALKEALLEDAARLTVRVDARSLVPFRLRARHGLAGVVTIAALVGVGIVANLPDAEMRATEDASRPAVPSVELGDREALAAEVERLAEAVEEEMGDERDAYLEALARAARDLASGVRSGATPASAAAGDLERLLSHLSDAIGPRFAAAEVRERGEAPVEINRLPMVGADAPGLDVGSEQSEPPTFDSLAEQVRSLRENLEGVTAARDDSPYGADFDPESTTLDNSVADQRAGRVIQGEGAGAPAGAAERSSDAPGDAAGAGSAELGAGRAEAQGAFAREEDVEIPDAAPGAQGARVRAAGELTEDQRGGVAGAGSALRSGDGLEPSLEAERGGAGDVRAEAGGWRRTGLDPSARRLASRLLSPPAEVGP